MITQEEMNTLSTLNNMEVTHIFFGIVVIEVQFGFKVRASQGQEQIVANALINSETGASMEYRNIMKDDQHRKSGSTHLQMNWAGWYKA